jgi:uncharacterized membrane protein YedE/YeeE
MATEFTPMTALAGGLCIGLSSAALLFFNGRIAGISGIFDGILVSRGRGELAWRVLFLAGMLVGGAVYFALFPENASFTLERPTPLVIGAGLLVGFGTKMSNGCTSGHGVCGNSRLSKRSIMATVIFFAIGASMVALFGGAG